MYSIFVLLLTETQVPSEIENEHSLLKLCGVQFDACDVQHANKLQIAA